MLAPLVGCQHRYPEGPQLGSCWRPAQIEGKAMGWFLVNLLNALLGQPVCAGGFVHLAAVKQGSTRRLLLQIQLLGNLSFRVLLF